MGPRGITNTCRSSAREAFTPRAVPRVGYLVGNRTAGSPTCSTMMNEARLEVNFSAAALGYTGYLKSLEYARNRRRDVRFSPRTRRRHRYHHRARRRQANVARAEVVCRRWARVDALLRRLSTRRLAESDNEGTFGQPVLDMLTPIAKSWPRNGARGQ